MFHEMLESDKKYDCKNNTKNKTLLQISSVCDVAYI